MQISVGRPGSCHPTSAPSALAASTPRDPIGPRPQMPTVLAPWEVKLLAGAVERAERIGRDRRGDERHRVWQAQAVALREGQVLGVAAVSIGPSAGKILITLLRPLR